MAARSRSGRRVWLSYVPMFREPRRTATRTKPSTKSRTTTASNDCLARWAAHPPRPSHSRVVSAPLTAHSPRLPADNEHEHRESQGGDEETILSEFACESPQPADLPQREERDARRNGRDQETVSAETSEPERVLGQVSEDKRNDGTTEHEQNRTLPPRARGSVLVRERIGDAQRQRTAEGRVCGHEDDAVDEKGSSRRRRSRRIGSRSQAGRTPGPEGLCRATQEILDTPGCCHFEHRLVEEQHERDARCRRTGKSGAAHSVSKPVHPSGEPLAEGPPRRCESACMGGSRPALPVT